MVTIKDLDKHFNELLFCTRIWFDYALGIEFGRRVVLPYTMSTDGTVYYWRTSNIPVFINLITSLIIKKYIYKNDLINFSD